MRLTNWLKSWALLGLLCVAAWPMAAHAQQSEQQPATDPMAEAARKAREQKKTEAKPKKVYTDDDFRPAPVEASSAKAATAEKAEAEGAEGTAQPAGKGEKKETGEAEKEDPEQKWRKRFKDMHAKIAQAEQELDILQRELNKGQVQYYTDPTKALEEQNSRKDIDEKTNKINEKKKEIEELKQKLGDMEDELRKSGGDIGWARE
jgi:predicted RNase H-like nuclease (RuvC/YqgF family)